MRVWPVVLLLCATPALARGKPTHWSRAIGAERPSALPSDGLDGALYRACGARSLALEGIAATIAATRAAGAPRLTPARLARMAETAGFAQPWPRAWSMIGDEVQVTQRFETWLAPERGVRRCGISRGVDHDGRTLVAAVTIDALAEVRLPRQVQVGSWVALDATLNIVASDAAVVLLGPDGNPRRVLAQLADGVVRSRFNLDRQGEWTVQLLATGSSGPEPVVQARLFAGVSPSDGAVDPAPPPPLAPMDVLMHELNGERLERGLPPLKRNHDLDRIAALHARNMADRGTVSHDAGDGDPVTRVHEAGVPARIVGENVARASDAARAHRVLWASPSHRGNMLSAEFGRIGVAALRRGASLWVVELFAD